MKGKNKLVPRLLGITKESVMRVDEKTKDVVQEWPLTTVKRWAASPKSFTLVLCATLHASHPPCTCSVIPRTVWFTQPGITYSISPLFAISDTVSIPKTIETSDSSVECSQHTSQRFIGVNSGCLGRNVQYMDVLLIWGLFFFFFQFSLPAFGNSAVCFPPTLQMEPFFLKIKRLCKF